VKSGIDLGFGRGGAVGLRGLAVEPEAEALGLLEEEEGGFCEEGPVVPKPVRKEERRGVLLDGPRAGIAGLSAVFEVEEVTEFLLPPALASCGRVVS
jgi:hypothetical protein